ncbi:MAG: DUF3857 domain-containing protein [Pseudomonadota bacterium]
MRLLFLVCFLFAIATPAWAKLAAPSGTANASAAKTFVRGAALPQWAQPLAEVPATVRTDPVVVRLSETQAWVGAPSAYLTNRAIQVNDKNSLGLIGQFGISYFPIYQKLYLHRVAILRAGQLIDQTKTVNVRHLQRETNMESGMYGGATTVQLLLDDVRAGDTLLTVYTIEGENPVFGNTWSGEFGWEGGAPVELRRLTVTHPRSRPIRWKQLGEFKQDAVEPVVEDVGPLRRLRFEGRAIEAIEAEPSTPNDYFSNRLLQFSEYQDWQGVAAWANGLFPKVTASAAMKPLLEQFGKQGDPAAKASAALRWVQNEVRYFSVSIGENSHRPQAPDTVIKRRYGDCKDKSYLLVSLLAQMGIEARPVLLSADAGKAPAKVIASPGWFNHVIVQVRIDGQLYYVDPTRTGQPEPLAKLPAIFSGASALVVDGATRELTLLPESSDSAPRYEHIENIVISSFDGDATLEMRDIFRANYADAVRSTYPAMTVAELKKDVLSNYEKQYPGVSLVEAPQYQDNSADNVFELRARFVLPKPLVHKDGHYAIDYDSQILGGTLGIPNKLVRNFPFELPRRHYRARYRLNISWPLSVRANDAPVAKTIDNPFFSMHEEYSYRGNAMSYLMDYRVKPERIAASELPELQKQAKQLNDFAQGNFRVNESAIGPEKSRYFSFRDFDIIKSSSALESAADALNGRKESGISVDEACEVGVQALRVAEFAGKQAEANVSGMVQELQKSMNNPGVTRCLAHLAFTSGDFAKSVQWYRREGPEKDDNPLNRELAWARFYTGDVDGALALMALYRTALKKGADGAVPIYELASELALQDRSGKGIAPELLEAAKAIPDGPWPRPLLAMQAGLMTPDALIALADAFAPDARELALHDAWYYIAQRRLAQHDAAGAARALRMVLNVGIRSSPLYLQAKAELRRLEPADPAFEAAERAVAKGDYAGALSKMTESARAGSVQAQYAVGEAYFSGRGTVVDYAQARHWYELAAAGLSAEAMNGLGVMYGTGKGVTRDQPLALSWFQKSADAGYMIAQANLAYRYKMGETVPKDLKMAARFYRLAAEQGYAQAQARLGEMYLMGEGVERDFSRAFALAYRAAYQGNGDGQGLLGYLFAHPQGMERDAKSAIYWYRLAAEQGSVVAQNNLGNHYEYGDGVPTDLKEAVKWYRLAADQGSEDGQINMGIMYENGRGVGRDAKEAMRWLRKAATANNPKAQSLIGTMYRSGDGVDKDINEALKWYRLAADAGNAWSQLNLGEIYASGEGVPKDPVAALKWLRQAAQQGNPEIQTSVAILLRRSTEIDADKSEALLWMRKAVEQGLGRAENELGDMYENGDGVARDLSQALALYRKAASKDTPIAFLSLGTLYERGQGVVRSFGLAYTYYQIGCAKQEQKACKFGETLAKQLSAGDAHAAQGAARNWKSGMPLPDAAAN